MLLTAVAGFATAALVGIAYAKTFTLQVAMNAKVTNTKGTTKRENIVVNSRGFALYTLSGETTHHALCTKAQGCFRFWPPLTVASAKKLSEAPGIKGRLGAWHRNGFFQVTLGGHPLYRFAADTKKHAATGEGIHRFGGTWHVAKAAATTNGTSTATGSTNAGATPPPVAPPAGPGPLKIGPTGRYLVTKNNQPFLMVGDSPQSVIGNLSESSAASFFADRAAHGFNTLWINLLCTAYTACNANGTTYDGVAPFTSGTSPSNYDLSTPNSIYFQRAHDDIKQAEEDGIEVVLDPIETGGWLSTLENNGNGTSSTSTKDYQYGVYLGNTFKDLNNIIWMSGNDFQTWNTSSSDNNDALAVAEGIHSADPTALQTSELNYTYSSSLDDSSWGSILGLNGAYTYEPTYAEVLHAYGQSSSIPTFMEEANYEGQQNGGTDGCIAIRNCRLQEYWTMTSGATGQLYGGPSYGIAMGWSASTIDTTGVTQLGYLTNLLRSLGEWYNLVPDQNHTLVTAGYGTFASSGSIENNNYVTAAETPDRKLALAYVPIGVVGGTDQSITVKLSQMAGAVTARWFDPTNGSFTAISGSPFTGGTGAPSHSFTMPGTNSAGDSDWLLVLETL